MSTTATLQSPHQFYSLELVDKRRPHELGGATITKLLEPKEALLRALKLAIAYLTQSPILRFFLATLPNPRDQKLRNAAKEHVPQILNSCIHIFISDWESTYLTGFHDAPVSSYMDLMEYNSDEDDEKSYPAAPPINMNIEDADSLIASIVRKGPHGASTKQPPLQIQTSMPRQPPSSNLFLSKHLYD